MDSMRSLVLLIALGFCACKPSAQSSPDLAASASATPTISSAQTASIDVVDAAISAAPTASASASSSATTKSNSLKPHADNAQSAAEKRQLEKLDALNRSSAVQNRARSW